MKKFSKNRITIILKVSVARFVKKQCNSMGIVLYIERQFLLQYGKISTMETNRRINGKRKTKSYTHYEKQNWLVRMCSRETAKISLPIYSMMEFVLKFSVQ